MTTPEGMLAQAESKYSTIYVIERESVRYLCFLGEEKLRIQSAMDVNDKRRLIPVYTEVMTVALAYVPDPVDIVALGLGGGTIYRGWRDYTPRARYQFVELDPEVLRLAQQYFDVVPNETLEFVEGDAADFLVSRAPATVDILVVDAFGGTTAPAFMNSREFVLTVRNALRANGVAVVNLSPLHMDVDHSDSIFQAEFGFVHAYTAGSNTILVCGDSDPGDASLRAAARKSTASALLLGQLELRVD